MHGTAASELSVDTNSVAVLGAGAVGCFLGGLLCSSGVSVTLIGRQRILDPIAQIGLTTAQPDGSRILTHPRIATEEPTKASDFTYVFLTLKAYAVVESIDQIERLAGATGVIVAWQNGVGTDEVLIEHFGPRRVITATSTASVGFDRPAVIGQYNRHAGLAWSPQDVDGSNAAEFATLLSRTGLPVISVPSRRSVRWSKLLLNSVGSAQCAILDTNMATIVGDTRLFGIEQQAMRETLHVMSAAGVTKVDLPGYRVRAAGLAMRLPLPVAHAVLGRKIAGARGGKAPTLRADVQRGGPSEIAYLNGAVATLGSNVGIETPVNRNLADLASEVSLSPELRAIYRHNSPAVVARLAQRRSANHPQ